MDLSISRYVNNSSTIIKEVGPIDKDYSACPKNNEKGVIDLLETFTILGDGHATVQDNWVISSPLGSLCHTPGVVCRPSSVLCHLCPPELPEIIEL